MISYFPAIYPDELVYSWLCRYYVHSGFFSNKSAMQELYCVFGKMELVQKGAKSCAGG